jgi:hypothetical protein
LRAKGQFDDGLVVENLGRRDLGSGHRYTLPGGVIKGQRAICASKNIPRIYAENHRVFRDLTDE